MSTTPKAAVSTGISSSVENRVTPAVDVTASNKQKDPEISIGTQIEIYWKEDRCYYPAKILATNDSMYQVEYLQDQTQEWLDLSKETYRPMSNSHKRRQIQEDSDESEAEFEDLSSEEDEEDDLDGAYVEKENDDEEEEDLDVMSEDDDSLPKKKKNIRTSKAVKVTRHQPKAIPSSRKATPPKSASSVASLAQFGHTPNYVTPSSSSVSATPRSASSTPIPSQFSNNSPPATSSSSSKPPMYEKNVVNPKGSHVHNHLRFLQDPRDDQGRARDHPDYDPRTLRVNMAEWEKHVGKMTNAVKQWWDLKKQYFDTVLLFKTGKFYEMFHMDADAGVDVCQLLYMKGHVAHAGFPESAYGVMADKLVRAGYKVARVEQTETPDMLQERKKKHRGAGPKPQVVNREVCSIMTKGTRTFCYLDNLEALPNAASETIGPLLAIKEVLVQDTSHDDGAQAESEEDRAVCEYGVTIVDAVHGSVTIGQFADDILRNRMMTLLTTMAPSEILLEGGEGGASGVLKGLIESVQKTSLPGCQVEIIRPTESFPKSTAIDLQDRRRIERGPSAVQPWDVEQTINELHRRAYYPRASKQDSRENISRWPEILRVAIEGGADLALSSFGAALYYLQRSLIDQEILSMGIVKAYVPPSTTVSSAGETISQLAEKQQQEESFMDRRAIADTRMHRTRDSLSFQEMQVLENEAAINHMALDGTTIHNLEILHNSVDFKVQGSVWSIINHAKTPHGSRLLRAWLLRPLFQKEDIDRRADAVEELVSGAAAVSFSEALSILAKCNDIERLLSRIHSMSGTSLSEDEEGSLPSERAVLYETGTYTTRKVGDFSKVLHGLRHASRIPELFSGVEIRSGLLHKITRHPSEGGCFPDMTDELSFFFDNFDIEKAKQGRFEPNRGVDDLYDEACDAIDQVTAELDAYKDDIISSFLSPKSLARSSWKYINTSPESKDKYLIELPANVDVPDEFIMKGKRGNGSKQVNKYRTQAVEELVVQLERAIDLQKQRKEKGMQLIFAKFDSKRSIWAAAAQATALLDALGSLAKASSKAGYSRPHILDCPPDTEPLIEVVQGRHPVVEETLRSSEFVPNDITLGLSPDGKVNRVLLLSGCNMGGKSTLLRQTCILAILAQIGCFVPAESCKITPFDRIYTRLGASDRILLGQSTFFVELAETAAALRGASRRSLVIMDELGRGTSTFDGTAIASASVKHLIEKSKCLSLFATHYHSLLDEWKDHMGVRLAHMECHVESKQGDEVSNDDGNITFLYSLGDGACPKSFGINVARLAGLPDEVLSKAKLVSTEFEREMNQGRQKEINPSTAVESKDLIMKKLQEGDLESLRNIWQSLQ